MSATVGERLSIVQRRRAMHAAYANAGLWGLGNGLASATLVIYLAAEFGAAGLAVSLILAAPRLVGLSRQFAPVLIDRLGGRKRFCIGCFLASSIFLAALPVVSRPDYLPSHTASLSALVLLWCAYRLLEYLAVIALWSWLADLVPQRIRGRFVGRRERWLNFGRVPGMLAGGAFALVWKTVVFPGQRELWWRGYAVPAVVGAAVMMAALGPLRRMPAVAIPREKKSVARVSAASLFAPFGDRRFLWLVAFGCWFSFFNGMTQSAQFLYPINVLGLSLLAMLAFRTVMRSGQSLVAPAMGRLADRFGNRPVLIVSQLVVASAMWFFLVATPATRWVVAGAWIAWIAYAGLNVCLPNLMLELSPEEDNGPYIAAYFAVSGVFYGISTIAGGVLFDFLQRQRPELVLGPVTLDFYGMLFAGGWVFRSLGVIFLLPLIEPGAQARRHTRPDDARSGPQRHIPRQ